MEVLNITKFDLVTIGHFTIDQIVLAGQSIIESTIGGPPIYASLAATSLGARSSVISKIGGDFPKDYLCWLKNQGVNLQFLKIDDKTQTTRFLLFYKEGNGRNLFLLNRAPPIELKDIPESLETSAILVAPIVKEINSEILVCLREKTNLLSLEPQGLLRVFQEDGTMRLQRLQDLEILKLIDVFKASEKEIEISVGLSNQIQTLKYIYKKGVRVVIVTKGRNGSLLLYQNRIYQIPAAITKNVFDTTGAGDVYLGAFLAEYIKDEDPVWSASVGSAAASFVIEELGPKGFTTQKKIYERAVEVYNKVLINEKI